MPELALIETFTETRKHDPDSRDALSHTKHVRLWPSSPGRLSLQIRTEGSISDHGTKSWQCYSTASLNLDAAKMLHAALQIWIEEQARRHADATYEKILEHQE